ncbi:hypothetical protein HYPSUDRAFT_48288 [Hypholoma sublateritium FD-334 SS-4]|uniref:Uncharacterized protein n=1 Tax=Hypholoma sublateritium (strain FD-334 SS-4) TaxID=945553 RepID=A0A0D2NFR9_HYPSF|nr:hypothetical protein HYPSUDRAFT_48288 [Hypholoma sublateritium FD-334 SS-4]
MHESSVCLPPELIDLIIDNIPELSNPRVSQAQLQRLPIFSALALVSHSFRSRANKRRFSHVTLHLSSFSAAHTLRHPVLERLILQTFWPEDLAISHHVYGLTLSIDLQSEHGQLTTWLDVGTVVKILQRIYFKESENITKTTNYALSLVAPTASTVLWNDLPVGLTDVVEAVCRSPNINSLRLIGLHNLPRSIVMNNEIKALIWRRSEFDSRDHPDFDGHNPPPSGHPGNAETQTYLSKMFTNLETLDVDDYSALLFTGSYNLFGASAVQRPGTRATTPLLKVLKVEIYVSKDITGLVGIVKQATTIEILQITLKASNYTRSMDSSVDIARHIFTCSSPHLTTLRIRYTFAERLTRVRRSGGGRVADLLALATIHTQLRDLDIEVLFGATKSSQSVSIVLRGHGCTELADFLGKREFGPQLRNVKISFVIRGPESPFHGKDEAGQEQRLFEENAERYLATYFTSLAELRPQIDIDISMVDERGHRYT